MKKSASRVALIAIVGLISLAVAASFLIYNAHTAVYCHPVFAPKPGDVRIACVGDSNTYGTLLAGWPATTYPMTLRKRLGAGCCVNNYSYPGRCARPGADKPLIDEEQYADSLKFRPDIAVVMLGSNDAREGNWIDKSEFKSGLKSIVDEYAATGCKTYLVSPPPAFESGGRVRYRIRAEILGADARDAVKEVASETGSEYIDAYSAFEGRPDLFADGVHLKAKGAKILADLAYDATISEIDRLRAERR